MSNEDVIDRLAGLAVDSPLAMIRDRKPVTRQQAQESYCALFEAEEAGDVTLQERFALARFVAGLHAQEEAAAFYAAGLAHTGPSDAFVAALSGEIANGRAVGPYGVYPKGPLSTEDVPGPAYSVAQENRSVLGIRMSAAMAHVHLLVFHPRDAKASGLQRLLDDGWSNAGIVTLSQLVAFLAFQLRAASALRTLAASA
jgi:CMD domain protein